MIIKYITKSLKIVIVKLFIEYILHPLPRTKKVKSHKELYESSINKVIRIIWYIKDEELIILVDMGNHDILKKLPGKIKKY